MSKFAINLSTLTVSILLSSHLYANNSPQQTALLEQIKNAEISFREDIVTDALFKLELIDANNPDYLLAKVRYYIRQGEVDNADHVIAQLQKIAPDSYALKEAKINQKLATIEGLNLLQEARQAVKNDNDILAVKLFDQLFNGIYPTVELQIEYLNSYFYLPNKKEETVEKLKILHKENPNNPHVVEALAKRYFYFGKRADGFGLLATLSGKGTESEVIGANAWLKEIQDWPISKDSLAALENMQTLFVSAKAQQNRATEMLKEQRSQMQDPAFYSRSEAMRVLTSKDKQSQKRALPLLLDALKKNPNDAPLLGEVGLIYAEQGQRQTAINYLARALHIDPQYKDSQDWQQSLNSNLYWLSISQGEKAKEQNQFENAQQFFQTAQKTNPKGIDALLGLADVAAAQNNNEQAEKYYLSALRLEKNNINAIAGITLIYLQGSPDKAYQYLNQLSASQKKVVDNQGRYLHSKILEALIGQAEQQADLAKVINLRTQLLRYDSQNIWNIYHLAKSYLAQGDAASAEKTIQLINQGNQNSAEVVYVQALYYRSTGNGIKAKQLIDALPKKQWNKEIAELNQQIQFEEIFTHAVKLRQSGQESEAINVLNQLPDHPQTLTPKRLLLSDWHLDNHQYDLALHGYQQVLLDDPSNPAARLGEVQSLKGLNQLNLVSEKITSLATPEQLENYSVYSQLSIANLFAELGQYSQSEQVFKFTLEKKAPLDREERPLVLRDSARILNKQGKTEAALNQYSQAMVASGLASIEPKSREELTRLTKHNPTDDWLKSSLRTDTASLAKRDDVRLTLEHDYWGSSGKSGYSKLRAQTTMLQADIPVYSGSSFLRLDHVNINAGNLKGENTGLWGSCDEFDCRSFKQQKYEGNSFALGWHNDTFRWDVGRTPQGFEVADWVGGIEYNSQFHDINWAFNAHRRPLTNSLLSYGGQKDPETNIIWGGVRKTGIALSGSYDLGKEDGYWADISADTLTGKNVSNNNSIRWMGGYYYKVINEPDRRISVGLNNMLWHYQKDLSGYTLGQGGYYSPQQYVSLGIPVSYRQRTENWSWEMSGSVSWSYSQTQNSRRYPIANKINESNLDDEYKEYLKKVDNKGSRSQGVGYTANLLVERKITPNWFVGASIDIQQAKDYTPSHALIYLRYSFDGWSGDLDMPPQPLTPYADFK